MLAGYATWIRAGVVLFAGVFFVVGVLRIVEFSGIGLGKKLRIALIAGHVAGCAAFSSALALSALDPAGTRAPERKMLFLAGLALLFPIHIYVALKRRIKIRDSMDGGNDRS